MVTEGPQRIVVMGVAGSGKTTVGSRLADRLGADFVDADSAHPSENVAKMSAGVPLSDDDRRPWLLALRRELSSASIVVTCSALRRSYRDLLRVPGGVRFVFLDIDAATAVRRLGARAGHFMRADMVDSQFADLERPEPDEPDVMTVDGTRPLEAIVDGLAAELSLDIAES